MKALLSRIRLWLARHLSPIAAPTTYRVNLYTLHDCFDRLQELEDARVQRNSLLQ